MNRVSASGIEHVGISDEGGGWTHEHALQRG